MHYLQLTNYTPRRRIALALGSERQITESPILALRVAKKNTHLRWQGKTLAERRRVTSSQTLPCQNEGGFPDRAARASCGREV